MPPRGPLKPGQKPDDPIKTFARVIGYAREYIPLLAVVVVLIVFSSLASIIGTSFMQKVIDNYLTPMLGVGLENADAALYASFIKALGTMLIIYLIGAVCAYSYQRVMLTISTQILFRLRKDVFTHMETLPIRYFDTNTHGDLMSRYTNDIDTIRELLSNSFSSFIQSMVTVIGVIIMMIYYSWQMTLITMVMMVVLLGVTGFIAKNGGKFFKVQQDALGKLNGYIEEMMDGQKVVKVFVHEKKATEEFDELNEALCSAATSANTFTNLMGPVSHNLGNIQYAIVAVAGSWLAINGAHGFAGVISVGTVVAFLTYVRSFTMPLSQIAQLFNTVLSALAGAERVFKLVDEEPETDDGYVTLVNANVAEDGTITESEQRTGIWAWKHPHKAEGTITYTLVKGNVEFDDVTFGYVPEKTVLHNISLWAHAGQKIAFVGSTGAGKTTITNLINRFYDIQDGKIRYDDINTQ